MLSTEVPHIRTQQPKVKVLQRLSICSPEFTLLCLGPDSFRIFLRCGHLSYVSDHPLMRMTLQVFIMSLLW